MPFSQNKSYPLIRLKTKAFLVIFLILTIHHFCCAQVPGITSIAPISGIPGSSVIITGSNFNGNAANNAVFFNGGRGTVTAASSTQLTVTVPTSARSGFIDVVNLVTYRQAKSRSQYIVTFNGSNFSSSSLASPVSFSTTSNANKIELADIDGDGKLDILAGVAASMLGILRNTTTTNTPTFATSQFWNSTLPYVEQDFSIGDLNSDGKLDIYQTGIIGNVTQQGYVAQNSSTIGSISSTSTHLASYTSSINQAMRAGAIADLSSPADGKPDVVWNFEASGGIDNSYLYTNVNIGASPVLNFGANVVLISSGGSSRMWVPVAADFDGDGLNDVASYESNGTKKLIISKNTTSGFTNNYYQINISSNSPQAGRLAVYDVDVDGKPDLVLMIGGNICRVYRNTSTSGSLNFALAGDFGATVANKAYFTMGDVTGDGKLDLVIACNNFTGSIAVLPNTTTGSTISFGAAFTFAGQAFTDVAVGDVNADGKPDIVAVNTLNSFASVFVNNTVTVVSAPTITSISPTFGPVGTSVVITGTNFTGTSAVAIGVGNTAASFTVNSATQITATVAAGTTNGRIQVTTPGGTATSVTPFQVTAPVATISSFTPFGGPIGTVVTITGTNFTAASGVFFGSTPVSSFVINSATQITATVGSGSTTGQIGVSTSGGTGLSATDFLVGMQPTITSFTPTSGPVGTIVTINGSNFTGTNSASFNNVVADNFTILNTSQVTARVAAGSTTGPIRVSGFNAFSISNTNFIVTTATSTPTITNLTPANGPIGTSVIITGTNFTGVSAVSFNNIAATTFSLVSATQITATVPVGATTGAVRITTPGGTATSATNFTVVPTPTIIGFSPSSGPVGTVVTITGTNFTGVSLVSINGIALTNVVGNSGTQITATIAPGTTTGGIRVVTTTGSFPPTSATSATNFTVTTVPTPTITSFSPTNGSVGTIVLISGTNFTNASAVSFNNIAATGFMVNSAATRIQVTVPLGATTGAISVTTPGGTATSSANFTIAASNIPVITNVDNNVFTGADVFITGQNLDNPTGITCGGITLPVANIIGFGPTFIRVTVPASWPIGTNTLVVTTANGISNSVQLTITHYVNNYRPGSGAYSGFIVAMNGTRLSTVNSVTIGGVAATFIVVNDTRINVTVPNFGVLGDKAVTITTPLGGAVQGPYPLRVIAATSPIITAISPLSGPIGSVVVIDGFNLNTVNSVRIGDVTLPNGTFTVVNANRINAIVPSGAQSDFFINVVNPTTGNLSDDRFTVTISNPSITSFTPASGPLGSSVTITGTNFTSASAVSFNNVAAASFTVNSATQITATVAAGTATGLIRVTTPGSTATSISNFTITASVPTITTVDLLSAPVNATITITGTNLSGAQVAISSQQLNILSNNGTTITVQAPSFALSGPMVVTTPVGAVQAGFFTHQTATRVLYHRAASVLTLAGPSGASSYQWQVNQGSGFNNLSNGGVYAGVNSRTLTVNNIPTSATGFQYRVVTNGTILQPAFTLRFVTFARTNGAWNDINTWAGGLIPDLNTDVIVDDVSVNVNVNAAIRTLNITPSGQLTVLNNINLTIRK